MIEDWISSQADARMARGHEAVAAELLRRGAERSGHGRGTILRHLEETHDLLATWGQPERLRLAGLVHNAYSTDAFGLALFDPSERDIVRALIGAEAERLVHIFGGIDRKTFFCALEACEGSPVEPLHLPDRRGKGEILLDRRDIGDLLVLYLANVATQACMTDGGPSLWLAAASRLGSWIAQNAGTVPPVFARCTTSISDHAEAAALEAYDTALRVLAADPPLAAMHLEAAGIGLPQVAEPCVWLGYLAFAGGDSARAMRFAKTALARFDIWGTAWDKRLPVRQWRDLLHTLTFLASADPDLEAADAVALAMREVTASPRDFHRALGEAGILTTGAQSSPMRMPGAPTVRLKAFPPRFRRYVQRQSADIDEPTGIGMYPGLTPRPMHDLRAIPIAGALETAAADIAREFAGLDTAMFADEAEDIERTGQWRVGFLSGNGAAETAIREKCPATAAVLERHETEFLGAGSAYFSCLAPGTIVAPHRGPTNTRLRIHLGLEIPEAGTGLRVGGATGMWAAGKCLVIDDSFIHSVWNTGARRRSILIVDIWHPDLTAEEVALLRWMYSR